MTYKQKQFNPGKVRLIDSATVNYIHANKPLDKPLEVIADKVDLIADTFDALTSIPKDGSDANILQKIGSTADVAVDELLKKEALFESLKKYAFAGAMAIELTPGFYEGIIGFIGINTLNTVGNTTDFKEMAISSAIAGVSAGAASGVEQALIGVLVSGTLDRFDGTIRFWKHQNKKPVVKENKEKGDLITGLVFGAPVAVVEQQFKDPERGLKQNLRLTASMSAKIAGLNAILLTGAAVGLQELQMHGQEVPADWIERLAGNPFVWIAGFGLYKYAKYRHNDKVERKKFKKLVNTPLPIA